MKDSQKQFAPILENLKIAELNEMQLKAMQAIEKETDVVLLAPTGSGKTLAFLLPLLNFLDKNNPGVQALILAPSRELSIQIESVFKSMISGFKVNCCYGGHSMQIEKNNLKQPPAVLIGTPGRIADHIDHRRINVSTIKTLVLDEFDKSLEMGFEAEMSFIIGKLRLNKRILTSATQAIEIPEYTGIRKAVVLDFVEDQKPVNLVMKAVMSDSRDKLDTLFQLLCTLGNRSTLVFCNHREAVERVSNYLNQGGIANGFFHGGMEQDDRERALIKFRNGSHHLLITTDLAARGLDIPEIFNIIHYHLPTTEDAFTHRNGRTARMNASGVSYVLLSKDENRPSFLPKSIILEELPANPPKPEPSDWKTLYLAAGKKDKISKADIAGFLMQKGQLQKDELGLIIVLDFVSFAAVKRTKAAHVVQLVRNETLKKKKVKIEIAN